MQITKAPVLSRRKHCAFTTERNNCSVVFEETVRIRFGSHRTKLVATLYGQSVQFAFATLRYSTTVPQELGMHILIKIVIVKSNTTCGYFVAKELYSHSVP